MSYTNFLRPRSRPVMITAAARVLRQTRKRDKSIRNPVSRNPATAQRYTVSKEQVEKRREAELIRS
jgi:acyl-coenzyme A thioesterase PaaI-like protein